jgi:hypothetical protein
MLTYNPENGVLPSEWTIHEDSKRELLKNVHTQEIKHITEFNLDYFSINYE